MGENKVTFVKTSKLHIIYYILHFVMMIWFSIFCMWDLILKILFQGRLVLRLGQVKEWPTEQIVFKETVPKYAVLRLCFQNKSLNFERYLKKKKSTMTATFERELKKKKYNDQDL